MRILSLEGSYHDIGIQHGRKLRELIAAYYSFCRMALRDVPEDVVKKTLSSVENGLRKGYAEALEELRGIAEGAGLSYEDILLMNFASEVRSQARLHSVGCTLFSAVDKATETGYPIMGKTRDMVSQIYFPFQIAMKVHASGRFEVFLAEAFSGMAVTGCGVNEHGLAVALSTIMSIEDADDTVGIQRAFLVRVVLERCRNVREALDVFSRNDMAYQGANFLICDFAGDCALIEKSHRHQSVIRPENGVIASTNHFDNSMLRFGKISTQSSKERLARIESLLISNRGKIDLPTAKRFLRDHARGLDGNSICRHTAARANTVQAYILEPHLKRVFIADGHPCMSRFQRYQPF